MSATATLNLVAPTAAQDVTVNLLVTSGNASDTEIRTFLHQPVVNTQWQDLGALTTVPLTLVVGDRVNVRTVSSHRSGCVLADDAHHDHGREHRLPRSGR